MKSEYVLEGRRTTTLAAFYAEVGQALLGGQPWGENLDALHEVLRGDYGQVPESFRLVWRDAKVAQAALGYPETVHQLTRRLRDCHPTSLIKTAWALRAALREQGPTVYDWLVELMGNYPNLFCHSGDRKLPAKPENACPVPARKRLSRQCCRCQSASAQ